MHFADGALTASCQLIAHTLNFADLIPSLWRASALSLHTFPRALTENAKPAILLGSSQGFTEDERINALSTGP